MNIYAKPGTKIKFSRPTAGYEHHQETAARYLTVGNVYTVHETDVGGWHTDVYLTEFPGIAFNSVMFSDIE